MTDPREVALRLMGNPWCYQCKHFQLGKNRPSERCPKVDPFVADEACKHFEVEDLDSKNVRYPDTFQNPAQDPTHD